MEWTSWAVLFRAFIDSMNSFKASSPDFFCLFFPFLLELLDSPRLWLAGWLWLVPGEQCKSGSSSWMTSSSSSLSLKDGNCLVADADARADADECADALAAAEDSAAAVGV